MTDPVKRKEKGDRLRALSDACDGHQCIRTRDGIEHEGWVDDIDESSLVFMYAPSPFYAQAHGTDEMAPPDVSIPLDEVVAWMGATREWIDL